MMDKTWGGRDSAVSQGCRGTAPLSRSASGTEDAARHNKLVVSLSPLSKELMAAD